MLALFVDQLLPERLINALCWTLVHSLWQGLALTILTGILILFMRRSGARIRYAVFSAAFLLFLATACGTFAWQWNKQANGTETVNDAFTKTEVTAQAIPIPPIVADPAIPLYQRIATRLTDYFNEHASLIVTIWFIIFSARLVRILGGLGRMQRIRHYRTHVPSVYWTDRVKVLAALLHIKVPVALLESELIGAPMMAGVFKPVILLPFSLLAQLPSREVEAILLHELAHIRRKDYLINLFQSFAEILFFFNPGVWWISSLIREERENCCDDMAIGAGGNKKEFIHALVSFQEYGAAKDKFSIALRGTGNHLLQRVKRILYQDNKILDGREKLFVGCSLVIMMALAFTLTSGPAARGAGRYVAMHEANSVFDGRARIASDTDSVITAKPLHAVRRSATVRREGPPSGETIDTKAAMARDTLGPLAKDTLPPPRLPTNPIRPKRITRDSPEMMEKLQRDEEMKQLEWQRKKEEMDLHAQEWKRAADGQKQKLNVEQLEELDRQRQMLSDQQAVLAERERELVIAEQKLAEQERMLDRLAPAESDRELKEQEIMRKERRLELKRPITPRQKELWKQPSAGGNQRAIAPVIMDLQMEDLIGDPEEFSFELNGKELKVNGKRQPEEVFKRFSEKYIKDSRDVLKYSRKKNGSESVTITIN
ncbi:MAG: M56 family metallopeptidase [Bacteroidota bacterium]|nr:M56 family metallopeptidase [Bacteroidota bacterium]